MYSIMDFDLLLSFYLGELELSNATVALLVTLTLFTFAAVSISSLKLVQSAVDKNVDKESSEEV